LTWLFITIWLAYTANAFYRNLYAQERSSIIGHVLQFGLLVMAILWAARLGLFSRWLWSPVDIVVGLILGHLIFSFSLLITHQHAGDVLRHSLDVRGITAFLKVSPELVFRFAGVCIIEELVYRAAAQDILALKLGHPLPAIVIAALFFCVLHQHFFRNGWACAVEFFLFSLTIGVVYYWTYSLTIVALAHLTRNLESAYLEYCLLLEEGKDQEEALCMLGKWRAAPATENP
jgi:membrane protease YdiL (CAAX protease family)